MIKTNDFEKILKQVVVAFYRDLKLQDGSTQTEINHCNRNFQPSIPLVMARYFSILGNAKDLNDSYYHILSPSEIFIKSTNDTEHLIVAHGHQQLSSFGIIVTDLQNDDPAVFEISEGLIALAFENISSFYLFLVLWQIINELIRFRATSYPDSKSIRLIEKESVPFTFSDNTTGDLRFFRHRDCLLLITTEGRKNIISVGGKTRESVSSFCDHYSLKTVRLRERI
ncbi:hypothetical protein [Zavarzinella formosa]|uniref:hypothetical protein n=1 Tax=Zavarzinella formosa TaxID=360055 RepID=UPI00036B946C|nr:hypothetical protein [Zavarzinella formosa]